MKMALPLVTSASLAILLSASLNAAQSAGQGGNTADKSLTPYKSPIGNQSNTNARVVGSTSDETIASSEAQKFYDAGMNLFNAGKIDEAINALKQAAKLRSEDAQTHYSLGMAYSKSRLYKEAADSLRRAVKLRPDWPEANFQAGIMSYVLGRRSQAIEAYNKLLKLNSPLANKLYRVINEDNAADATAESGNASRDSSTKPASGDNSARGVETSAPVRQTQESSGISSSARAADPRAEERAVTEPDRSSVSAAGTNDQSLTSLYRVGVGDVLDIRLLNSITPRSTLYTVVPGGMIDLPIIGGALPVAGLTTDEIQNRITAELKRRAVEAESVVTVGVRQYASHPVIVTGLVANPGTRYLRREAVPLYVIMAEVQPRADAARATIVSTNGEKQSVDLNDSAALGALVRPGDVVNLGVRPQEFYYIGGRINYPGQKPFQPGITLLQAILAAGGTARQNDNNIDISREVSGGLLSTTRHNLKDIKSGKIQDPKLQPGDRIEVVH